MSTKIRCRTRTPVILQSLRRVDLYIRFNKQQLLHPGHAIIERGHGAHCRRLATWFALSLQIKIRISDINSVLIQRYSHSSCNWVFSWSSHGLGPKKLFVEKILKAVWFPWPSLSILFKYTNQFNRNLCLPIPGTQQYACFEVYSSRVFLFFFK